VVATPYSASTPLPSCMTCTNELKLPTYPTKKLMREKLLYSMAEGQGFGLS